MSVLIDGSAGITTNTGAVFNGLQSTTAVASTSGTSILFTGIPLWVKRITVMLNGVSTNGTSNYLVQIGSGSVTTSGYQSTANTFSTTPSPTTATSGFLLTSSVNAASTFVGQIQISTLNNNIWVTSGAIGRNDAGVVSIFAGNITLAGTLDRVNITTVAGTDTFDAGSINLIYE